MFVHSTRESKRIKHQFHSSAITVPQSSCGAIVKYNKNIWRHVSLVFWFGCRKLCGLTWSRVQPASWVLLLTKWIVIFKEVFLEELILSDQPSVSGVEEKFKCVPEKTFPLKGVEVNEKGKHFENFEMFRKYKNFLLKPVDFSRRNQYWG